MLLLKEFVKYYRAVYSCECCVMTLGLSGHENTAHSDRLQMKGIGMIYTNQIDR